MGSATSTSAPAVISFESTEDEMLPIAIPSLPPKPISSPINARAGPGPSTLSLASSSKVSLPYEPVEKEEGEISDDEPLSPLPPLPVKRQISPTRRRLSSASPSTARFPPRPSRSPQQASFPPLNHYRTPRPLSSLPQKRPRSPIRIDKIAVVRAKVDQDIPKEVANKAEVDAPEVTIKVEESVLREAPGLAGSQGVLDVPDIVARISRDSPGPISAAPASITPQEARQYMDIIRNLLQNGFSPDDLIGRGATAKYVTAVCQEIVTGQKRRDSAWLETREGHADSEQPSTGGREEVLSSLSTEHLVTGAPMERKASQGSETSDERAVENMMSPASPKAASGSKLVASSSWHPGPIAPIPPFRQNRPPPTAVKIESYRPTPPSRPIPPTGPSSMSSTSSSSTANLTVSMKNFHPMSSYSKSRPNNLPPPPHQYRPPPAPPTSFRPSLPPRPPPPIKYDSPVFGQRTFTGPTPTIPATLPNPPTAAPPPLPPSTASRNTEAELAARIALLETRRKAFESMKKRREVNRATPHMSMEVEPVKDSSISTAAVVADMPEAEKSIEEQMADLEKEVMGLQTESAKEDTVMDVEIDEEEEGEIEDTPPPVIETALLPLPVVPTVPAVPVRVTRGTKRTNAEDMMENRPTSLPSRLAPHKRRSLFGGVPQKPQRLLLQIDLDSDSDDTDEDSPTYSSKVQSVTSTPIILPSTLPTDDTARLLKEKEESIRKLREEIERKMRAKIVAKKEVGKQKGSMEVQIAEVEKEEMVQAAMDVVMAENGKIDETIEAMEDQHVQEDPDVIMGNDEKPAHTTEVTAAPPSTPSQQPNIPTYFRPYITLLPRYRQLVKAIMPDSQLEISGSEIIDLSLLAEIVLTRRLQKEPEAVLCMAEVAGGSCADEGCEDVHIVKGLPGDDDLAQYISYSAPGKSITLIRTAIIKARESLGRSRAKNKGKGKSKGKGKAASVLETQSRQVEVLELVTNVAKLLDL